MTCRSMYLLSGTGCLLLTGGLAWLGFNHREAVVAAFGARLVTATMLCAGVGGLVLLLWAAGGSEGKGGTCFSCGRKQEHLDTPAFAEEWPCPCSRTMHRDTLGIAFVPPLARVEALRPAGPPRYRLASAGESLPIPVERLLAALASCPAFTVGQDEAGLPLLTRTRLSQKVIPTIADLLRGPEKLSLRYPLRDEVRPDDVVLDSTSLALVAECCVALARAFGPLLVQREGAADWLPASAGNLEALLGSQGLPGGGR